MKWFARSLGMIALAAVALQGCEQAPPKAEGGAPTVRRLTESQYRNIIADVFGKTIIVAGRFDPIDRADGLLSVGAGYSSIPPAAFERYDGLARNIAAQVVAPANRDYVLACTPGAENAPDDACAKTIIQETGRLLFRRPLTQGELEALVAYAHESAASLGNFYGGVGASVAVMLEAPPFLYISESPEADPDHAGTSRLDGYSKATRLSFFLWNTTPDDELLRAAAAGELHTEEGLTAQADRMLDSPRVENGVRAVFTDILALDKAETLEKDTQIYPAFMRSVAVDAREQTLRTIVDVLLVKGGDYRDLFTTRKTFLSPSLATVHRVPMDKPEGGWVPYEFPDGDPRVGLISQLSFVAMHSHPGKSSPTLRGRAIRELLLCQKIPDPPGDVNFANFNDPNSPGKTARERLTMHSTEASCSGCHKLMDPIGLTLEKFDGAGQLREMENGERIDVTGDLNGIAFADSPGLAKAIRDDPALSACLINKTFSYATGRRTTKDERGWMDYFNQRFVADKYSFVKLMRRMATAEEFYAIAPAGKSATASAQ